MRAAWISTRVGLARLWHGLREWCGDAAYERYVQATMNRDSGPVPSPKDFYVEQMNRKYSRPNRCC